MLYSLVSLLFLLAIIYFYGRWLYVNRHHSRYYLAPLGILGTCLLLGGLSQSYVFERAVVESYSTQTGWFSETVHHEPQYEGEDTPLLLLVLGPIVGLVLLLVTFPPPMRKVQAIHLVTLLVFVYPWLALLLLLQVGGSRPSFYNGESLPAIGTRVPTRP